LFRERNSPPTCYAEVGVLLLIKDRFKTDIMINTVIILIVVVQIVQSYSATPRGKWHVATNNEQLPDWVQLKLRLRVMKVKWIITIL
jgi:hypothetical protein